MEILKKILIALFLIHGLTYCTKAEERQVIKSILLIYVPEEMRDLVLEEFQAIEKAEKLRRETRLTGVFITTASISVLPLYTMTNYLLKKYNIDSTHRFYKPIKILTPIIGGLSIGAISTILFDRYYQ